MSFVVVEITYNDKYKVYRVKSNAHPNSHEHIRASFYNTFSDKEQAIACCDRLNRPDPVEKVIYP